MWLQAKSIWLQLWRIPLSKSCNEAVGRIEPSHGFKGTYSPSISWLIKCREAWSLMGWELYKTRKGKAGGVCVAIDLPTDNTHINDYQLLFQSTITWYTHLILLAINFIPLAINFIVFLSVGSDKNHSPAMIIKVTICGYKDIYKIVGLTDNNICSGSGIDSWKANDPKPPSDTLAIGITP